MAENQQPSALTGSAGLWSAVVLLVVAGIVGVLYVQNDADLHRAENLELQKNLEGQITEALSLPGGTYGVFTVADEMAVPLEQVRSVVESELRRE